METRRTRRLALDRLLELDPRHPAAAALSERLNSAFKSRAEEAGRLMARARGDADAAKADRSEAFAKADSAAGTRGRAFSRETSPRLRGASSRPATRYDRARRAAKAPTPAATGPRAPPRGPCRAPPPLRLAPEPAPETTPAAASGPARAFVTGNTQIAGARSGGGVQGFDTADVKTRRTPDFVGHIEFEVTPAAVKAGDPVSLRVFVVNEGKKPVRVRERRPHRDPERQAVLPARERCWAGRWRRSSGSRSPKPRPSGRTESSDWSLDAVVTSDRDETGIAGSPGNSLGLQWTLVPSVMP